MFVEHGGLTFERLGHASVRTETGDGTAVYIDPWSEVIETEPGDGDVVFVTHDDPDHYDPAAIEAVTTPTATVAAYERIDTANLDREVLDLPLDGERDISGIDVRTVPAYNDPDGEHTDEDGVPFHAEGEVIGLLLGIEGTTVFFPADTDFLDRHDSLRSEVFVPPIGGHYTMDRHEAAAFARSVDPELVLPVHYDTFEAVEADADAFAAELEDDGIAVELF
jgi:L-ascorbate metabolism protein UlaG (beta-lactamase superfamily)